jgi:ornithine carbamoyltransferase
VIRHFLRDDDLTTEEQTEILDLADAFKAKRFHEQPLSGPQSVAVVFDKPSTRTRVSFSVGVAELGGYPLVIDAQSSQMVRSHFGALAGKRLTYLGDGANNMAHSYLLGGALAGMHVRVGSPAEYAPTPAILERAAQIAAETGGSVGHETSPEAAVDGVDVVATDTWVSMGQEAEAAERTSPFQPYSVTSDLMRHAAPHAIVLHCLPAYRGKEIAAEVIDGPQSVVWVEAENRLHAQKALLTWLLRQARAES